MDEQITKVDPYLWNALCSITRSKSEICGRSKVDDPLSQVHHLKRIRCFFLLCVIMFITDDRCSMPMHTLLTDMVESQGGSSVLVRTLNRLGVCSSADTLARFIQHKRSACEYPCIKHLTKDAFMVVSADNLDFLHSFSRVFCGNQKSSWHGTTVQVVQPLPSLSLPEYFALPQMQHTYTPCSEVSLSLTASHEEGPLSLTASHEEGPLSLTASHGEAPHIARYADGSLSLTASHGEAPLV